MKILNLILYSQDAHYEEMRQIQRAHHRTMGSKVMHYFYCYDNTLAEPFKFDGDMLYIKGVEAPSTMSAKTFEAIEICLEHFNFDIMVRTNISTICKVEQVVACFSEKEKLYGGNVFKEAPFISGICVVLTRDMVQRFVESKNVLPFYEPEDIVFAKFYASIGIPMTPINQHFGWNVNHNDENLYVFRNKRDNRQEDVQIMRQIVDEIIAKKTSPPTLHECAKNNINDKCIDYGHNYLPGYESLFSQIRQQVKNVFEIGIGNRHHEAGMRRTFPSYRCGNSLRMWKEYFPNANIYSIDIAPDCMVVGESRIQTFVADQSSASNLHAVLQHIGADLDIIIDDGSHYPPHQIASFQILYKNLLKGGIYVIEDVSPSFIDRLADLSAFSPEVAADIKEHFETKIIDSRKETSIPDDLMFVLIKK